MAIYLKIIDGAVRAYGDEESLASAGGSPDATITEAEWDAARNKARVSGGKIVLGPDEETLAAWCRAARDLRLQTDVDPINAVRWAAMTKAQRAAWTEYRQKLLDLPQTDGFPWDGSIPSNLTKPE